MNIVAASKNHNVEVARLISNVFHPWVVLAPVLALAAYQTAGGGLEWIKWALLAYIPALFCPLLYAKIVAVRKSRNKSEQKISRSLVRDNARRLFVSAALFGIPSALILYFLNGPQNLFIIIMGITAVMFVIALVNIKYRASFHLSMVTCMLTSMWFIFGNIALFSFILLPLLGISRYQLGEHTPMQMTTGFIIGLAIGCLVFFSMGLTA